MAKPTGLLSPRLGGEGSILSEGRSMSVQPARHANIPYVNLFTLLAGLFAVADVLKRHSSLGNAFATGSLFLLICVSTGLAFRLLGPRRGQIEEPSVPDEASDLPSKRDFISRMEPELMESRPG